MSSEEKSTEKETATQKPAAKKPKAEPKAEKSEKPAAKAAEKPAKAEKAEKPAAAKAEKPAAKAKKSSGTAGQLNITLVRSLLGRPETHRKVAYALGLRKSQRTVSQYDTPIIRGMIRKISHLLHVEEVTN